MSKHPFNKDYAKNAINYYFKAASYNDRVTNPQEKIDSQRQVADAKRQLGEALDYVDGGEYLKNSTIYYANAITYRTKTPVYFISDGRPLEAMYADIDAYSQLGDAESQFKNALIGIGMDTNDFSYL